MIQSTFTNSSDMKIFAAATMIIMLGSLLGFLLGHTWAEIALGVESLIIGVVGCITYGNWINNVYKKQ